MKNKKVKGGIFIERFIFTYAAYLNYGKEILKMIEESESEEYMSTIRERLREEYINERKQGIAIGISQGIAQTITQTIEKMIKMNFKDETIEEATGAEKKEIERIRKEVTKQD